MNDERPEVGRRAFLALGSSAVLAGCVGGSDSSGDSGNSTTMRERPATSRSTPSTTVPVTSPTATSPASTTGSTDRRGTVAELVRTRSSRDEPQATARIGKPEPSGDGSGTITIWNDAGTARAIRTTVSKHGGGSVFRETYRLEPDAYVEIEVTETGTYTLGVGVSGDKPVTVDFTVDTCNSLGINVAIRGNGTVESTQISTAVGCPMVTTTDTTR
jgi:hypothetical protein